MEFQKGFSHFILEFLRPNSTFYKSIIHFGLISEVIKEQADSESFWGTKLNFLPIWNATNSQQILWSLNVRENVKGERWDSERKTGLKESSSVILSNEIFSSSSSPESLSFLLIKKYQDSLNFPSNSPSHTFSIQFLCLSFNPCLSNSKNNWRFFTTFSHSNAQIKQSTFFLPFILIYLKAFSKISQANCLFKLLRLCLMIIIFQFSVRLTL